MNLTKKQKNRIYACIILAITGDTISYFNGVTNMNVHHKKNNTKQPTFRKLYNYNNLNLRGWGHSVYSIWVYFMPPDPNDIIQIGDKYKIKKHPELAIHNIHSFIKTHQVAKLIKSKLKYKDVNLYPVAKFNEIYLKKNIIRVYNKSVYQKHIQKIIQNKNILIPSDEFILIGIQIGLIFTNKLDFKKRDEYITGIISLTHSHPYSYMAIILLATLITNLYNTRNIIQSILDTNKYFQNDIHIVNKTEQKFCDEFNKFVKKTIITKKNIVTTFSGTYKKVNALTTILIAINSFLKYPTNWKMLIEKSGIIYQTNPASCAIACSFYGLIHGLKNVPKVQYQNVENNNKIVNNFFQRGKYKNLPFL